MMMSIGKGRGQRLKLIDSLNFLTMPLKAFPKTFGLTELKKGYFPHFFNTKENESYVGPMPAKKHYGYNQMSTKDRATFLEWYNLHKDDTFDMKKEILEYCISDVDILKHGCEAFRQVFMENEGIDPFNQVTIASTCMKIYRAKYMPHNHIAILPEVKSPETHSKVSLEWLEWVAAKENITIQHALNDCEFKIPYKYFKQDPQGSHVDRNGQRGCWEKSHYKVDGYHKQSRTCFEFHGCYWHGCPSCYENKPNTLNTNNGKTMRELHQATQKRIKHIESKGYEVVEMWECQWKRQKEQSKDIREFPTKNEINTVGPLNPRDAMFGGRVNAAKLMWDGEKDIDEFNTEVLSENIGILLARVEESKGWPSWVRSEKDRKEYILEYAEDHHIALTYKNMIKDDVAHEKARSLLRKFACYVDITSLYPTVQYYDPYPVGHPQRISAPEMKKLENREYFGLVKCRVLPPRNLYHPLLPLKLNGKLTFSLCYSCAATCNQGECNHTHEQRSMIGTWTTAEIYKAMDLGYQIEGLYEVWHWEKTSTELFKSYVSRFLKLKQQASGWPAWCKTEVDKKKYVDDYYERQGIKLNPDKIVKNPGLRAMAKLCLNSLWGKFGQSPYKNQTAFIKSQKDLYKFMTNPVINDLDINIINSECIEVNYKEKSNHIADQRNSNIAIAIFTTSHARLRLYQALEKLDRQVLYYDTDSVVYAEGPHSMPLGDLLGEWTDELDGCKITSFVSGGPKNYSLRLDNGTSKVKIKGFSLHHENSQVLNIDTMKAIIQHGLGIDPPKRETVNEHGQPIQLTEEEKLEDRVRTAGVVRIWNDRKITRIKKEKRMISEYMEKAYGFTYTKRRIMPPASRVPTHVRLRRTDKSRWNNGVSDRAKPNATCCGGANGIIDTVPYGFVPADL
jgi:hypothetical protein